MNNRPPVISVILPVKNPDQGLLDRAISSIKNQTFQDFEILLIDDGSGDDFAKALERTAETDSRTRLFHIAPSGVSGARNYAMEQAFGDYLTFLDGDDALSPYCFEEAVALLSDPETDILWGGTRYGSSEEIELLLSEQKKTGARSLEELQKLCVLLTPERIHTTRAECIGEPFRFDRDGYINRGIAARFLKKKVLENGKARFPLGIRMYEDAIWNLRMMEDFRIKYVKSIWYYYYNNDSSVSNSYNPEVLDCMEIPLSEIRRILDLENEEEYIAYTRLLMDSLRYVYKCLYGNPNWSGDKNDRKKLRDHLYRDMPWSEIASARFKTYAEGRDKQKSALFRARLLFLYWNLTWKKM